MSILSLFLTAVGLSMDAFAVSISDGMRMKKATNSAAMKIALYMGGFQAFMPALGWCLGIGFKDYITAIDHWIALILLSIIGGKMIYEAVQAKRHPEKEEDGPKKDEDILSSKVLLLLAIATSIDALAVGVSFAFLNVDIVSSASIIGIITFAISFTGVKIGRRFGALLKENAEIVGGVILILIGMNIFLEHTNLLNIF